MPSTRSRRLAYAAIPASAACLLSAGLTAPPVPATRQSSTLPTADCRSNLAHPTYTCHVGSNADVAARVSSGRPSDPLDTDRAAARLRGRHLHAGRTTYPGTELRRAELP